MRRMTKARYGRTRRTKTISIWSPKSPYLDEAAPSKAVVMRTPCISFWVFPTSSPAVIHLSFIAKSDMRTRSSRNKTSSSACLEYEKSKSPRQRRNPIDLLRNVWRLKTMSITFIFAIKLFARVDRDNGRSKWKQHLGPSRILVKTEFYDLTPKIGTRRRSFMKLHVMQVRPHAKHSFFLLAVHSAVIFDHELGWTYEKKTKTFSFVSTWLPLL